MAEGEQPGRFEIGNWIAGGIVVLGSIVLVVGVTVKLTQPEPATTESAEAAPAIEDAPAEEATLAAAIVAQCRDLLASRQSAGVILGRPAPNRINVDDALWQQLPAETKDRLLQSVACDLWQQAMPAGTDHVVAYGYRSGKRVQMLTAVGMVRE